MEAALGEKSDARCSEKHWVYRGLAGASKIVSSRIGQTRVLGDTTDAGTYGGGDSGRRETDRTPGSDGHDVCLGAHPT